MKTIAACSASVVIAALSTSIAHGKLNVGDPAPKLQTGRWVQGDPVKEFEKDKAYIVEFWATWCGPCKVSIPHLNDLHNKYKGKGLVVIGQDCWERDESLVEPFIKNMGDKMTYRVALDLKSGDKDEGAMATTWMKAAGQNGIPSAFLVDKAGKIAWLGHPMSLKDAVIEEVLAGTYDLKKAAEDAKAEAEKQEVLRTHSMAFQKALQAKEWDKAEAELKELEKLLPEKQGANLDMARLQILLGKQDYPAAFKLVEKISVANQDNAMLNNQLAWDLATRKDLKERDLAVLEKVAGRAQEASKGKDAAIIDTVARIKFMAGKKEEAVELQQKAVDLCDEADTKEQLKKTLAAYKEGKLPSDD